MLLHHSPAVANSVKTAWKLLVQRLGGVDATAACTRAQRSRVSEYGTIGTDRWAPVDVILDAETIAGVPMVTAALARAQGYDLVPVVPHGDGELPVHLARIGATAGDMFRAAAEALADGVLTEAERIEVAARMADAARVLQQAQAALLAPVKRLHVVPGEAA